jgi:hypothetical protein
VRDQIDCRVASGEHLRFTLFKEGRPLSPMGGNFVYVADDEDAAAGRVVYAGETDNLALHAQVRWAEAQSGFGVKALYTRLNITAAVRRREHVELLQALDPPMNADEPRPRDEPREGSSDKGGAAAGGF